MHIGLIEILLIALAMAAVMGTKQLPKFGKAVGRIAKDVKENTKTFTETIKVIDGEMKDIREMASVDLRSGDEE